MKYLIDQHYNIGKSSLKVVSSEDVNVIIVTSVMEYENIESKLRSKTKAVILALEV